VEKEETRVRGGSEGEKKKNNGVGVSARKSEKDSYQQAKTKFSRWVKKGTPKKYLGSEGQPVV